MSLPALIDDYQLHLFSSVDEMERNHVPAATQKRLIRLRGLYTFWLNFPAKTSAEMVRQNMTMNPDIKQREAYDDIKLIKILIGNLEAESKEWHRHVFNKRTEEIYAQAMRDHDNRAAEKANADYAKYNRVGELDPQPFDYDDIIPHQIEPTDDPTVIGIEPVKNLREQIRKLKRKFGRDIEDAEFVEMPEP